MSARGTSTSEDGLIARYFRPLATDPGALDLIDDAAILRCSDQDVVVTTDAIVEGVHFLPDDPPDTIARKALRVNLSDLAAKGAAPAGFVLTLALRKADEDWLQAFAQALGEDAKDYACPLLGGDTVSTPGPLMISITAFGRVSSGKMVRRDGAKSGDVIAVTETIGDAALGLKCLRNEIVVDQQFREPLISRYRIPQPRNGLASAIHQFAHAAMDVSDGLAGDLIKLCAASGVTASVEASSVPLSQAAKSLVASGAVSVKDLLVGGDDYEVLCAVPENRWESFQSAARTAGVDVTIIGQLKEGEGVPVFLDSTGSPMTFKHLSYSHF